MMQDPKRTERNRTLNPRALKALCVERPLHQEAQVEVHAGTTKTVQDKTHAKNPNCKSTQKKTRVQEPQHRGEPRKKDAEPDIGILNTLTIVSVGSIRVSYGYCRLDMVS